MSWEVLEDTISKIARHHIRIAMGDFNAQLGKEKEIQENY